MTLDQQHASNIRKEKAPSFCTWWILFCAYCSLAGWLLSLMRALNATCYAISFFAGGVLVLAGCRRAGIPLICFSPKASCWRRFRRPLPLGFLILAGLAAFGGAIHAPTNWDALSYRVPRVLHWLAAGHWHWIHTMFERLNVRGCGYEWIMAPAIALTKTDRLLFLPNLISFCLLPGLFFSALTGVAVKRNAAWAWMWLLPSGYCYLMQAGSLGNDLLGSFFALAAFAYALQGRRSQRPSALWISAIAMALSTAVKANNLLLLVIWAVVFLPSLRLFMVRLPVAAAVVVLAFVVSLVPTAVLNSTHVGDWTGTRADQMQNLSGQHFERVVGNGAITVLANLTPPVAPFAPIWNKRIAPNLLPQRFDEVFGVAPGQAVLEMDELQTEESAGIGFGVSILLVVTAVSAWRVRRKSRCTIHLTGIQLAVFVATLLALAAFFGASFPTKSEARLLNGYYAFLVLPFLIFPGHECIVRQRWWQFSAIAVIVLAVAPVTLCPARPLIPVQTLVNSLVDHDVALSLLGRARKVYSVYSVRAYALLPLSRLLPADVGVVGLISFDDLETSLWKPFGSRRIVHVCPSDTPEQLRESGVRYIWINSRQFARFGIEFATWLKRFNAEVVREEFLTLRGSEDASRWLLVQIQ